jgi:hypothetical protein
VLVAQAATSTFAILVAICFFDVMAGLFVRIRAARYAQPPPAPTHDHPPVHSEV